MKDERTEEQKYHEWVSAITFCHRRGWVCSAKWKFFSPSGTLHDLSAADLTKLESIEANGLFLVKE